MMNSNEEILYFIEQWKPAQHLLTNGMCYWFAQILMLRFPHNEPILMYDEIANHFGVNLTCGIYDVTGEVSVKYCWKPIVDTDAFKDDLQWSRIVRDCILKEKIKEE